ncbi:MAG: hypothetical protein K8T25_04865 [Planctomycetia bacterium]|nr:hypothetical protein [Planctomycetia bacterium]
MSNQPAQNEPLLPYDNLPEVRPPSAGFIVQLFVIPALVVLVIVLVWLLFNWLAHMGGSPTAYVAEMKKGNSNSWQQANNLAEELRRNPAARRDPALAKEVATYLDELLREPLPAAQNPGEHGRDPRSEEIERRGFLCQALGQFEIAEDALPVLLRAAAPQQTEDETKVRLSALQGISILAENVRSRKPLADPRLLPTLILASRADDQAATNRADGRIIAVAGTFSLGLVGGDQAIARLTQILKEPHSPDVHYNAALGLARNGDGAGLDVIREMIDPASTHGVDNEEQGDRAVKQAHIQMNALLAVRQLATRNADVDLSSVVPVIQKLIAANPPAPIKVEANQLVRELAERKPAAKK